MLSEKAEPLKAWLAMVGRVDLDVLHRAERVQVL